MRALTSLGFERGLKGGLPSSFIFQKSWQSGVCTLKVVTWGTAGLEWSWLLNRQLLPTELCYCPLQVWQLCTGTQGTGQKL